ncbi:DUF6765 family protein [Bdellovibrio bacteriovorus]|uniref:DUF6765 family protein n=1 Tax=Bdellovibrio bacteriovorus TaxID=959 RepID=UPI0035A6F98E
MQIDFHLGVTYVLARLSGFSPYEANTIASASQYVDDAIHEGTILFNNRSMYKFTASAHKMLDYRNFKELANHHVWIPFHFIPGNSVSDPQMDPLTQKLICRPNSKVAQDITQNCIQNFQRTYGYHLLGVTTHAYVDTWAHQGFSGITHESNKVYDIYDDAGSLDHEMLDYRDQYFKSGKYRPWWRFLYDRLISYFVSEANPIGHGSVLSYPDLPYLKWSYRDWKGRLIERDNPTDYMTAVHHVLDFYKRLRETHKMTVIKIQERDIAKIKELLENIDNEESEDRLKKWKHEIRCGAFSFGTDTWKYSTEGQDSWLKEAFDYDTQDEFEYEDVVYKETFLTSNWKMMHDALAYYRFSVLHEILPRYQICVA